MNRLRGENRLVSLVEKAKSECTSIALAVRNDLKTIEEAREAGLTWSGISEGLGFPGKLREVQRAYSREKARQQKKGGRKPAVSQPQKTEDQKTENGKQNEVMPAVSKHKSPQSSEPSKNSGSSWREIKY